MIAQLLLLLLFIYYIANEFYLKRKNLPPGPTPLPIIGNLLSLYNQTRWEHKFIEWKNKYGPIYTYWMGNLPFVSINDHKLAYKVFVKNGANFENRLDSKFILKYLGNEDKIKMPIEVPQKQRKFAVSVFRQFGFGTRQIEENILTQIQFMFGKINQGLSCGVEEVALHIHTDLAVGSLISEIICGYKADCPANEKRLLHIKEQTARVSSTSTNLWSNLIFSYPWVLNIPFVANAGREAASIYGEILDFMEEQVNLHLKQNDYTEDYEATDFVNAFLVEKKRQENLGNDVSEYTVEQLKSMCFNLWVAGQETTSLTITWAIAFILRHPEVQEKIHEELDSVHGSEKMITIGDKPLLSYCNAVVFEAIRCANLLGQNLTRVANDDIEIEGYLIKKGTVVFPQVSVILQDEKAFPEPQKFNPSRFLDENENLKNTSEFIPFSLGRRMCIGESLAKMELFLIIANLFNQYKIMPGKVMPSARKTSGNSTDTEPYSCRLEKRW
ncbi:unnamed protein product [Bursaphelenchus okinawaensis]|uniref:CYtochrome P450 family n=1 Tax=Bursaphelenchus okinawaensis TaxID=465554 RepID=A0A811L211_9BILA|nr:unnamed protein product [Bursaphelenchus okinawaensis]CAG9115057.1 unnamed protein product [Bursaphelenchus okinawaensis]